MLALALITLELETCCPDWLALTIDLLRKAQVPDCLCLIIRYNLWQSFRSVDGEAADSSYCVSVKQSNKQRVTVLMSLICFLNRTNISHL